MTRLYATLLRLLPRSRRARCAADMALVFEDLRALERRRGGVMGVFRLWLRELMGLVRFIGREWLLLLITMLRPKGPAPNVAFEVRMALRGLRPRRGSALLATGLLALALVSTTLMFAVVDSLVLRRIPYRNAADLVEIQRGTTADGNFSNFLPRDVFDRFRQQTDLFAGVHGYLTGSIFVLGEGATEQLRIASLTPGLLEMLGATPRWGRPLLQSDTQTADHWAVLVNERLATKWFGTPAAALGRRVETTVLPLRIVGVLDNSFAFPTSSFVVWRALDHHGPLTRSFAGVATIARRQPGVDADTLAKVTAVRGQDLSPATPGVSTPLYRTAPLAMSLGTDGRQMMLLLLAAASCLLLTACVNVLNLELARAMGRVRQMAIQSALGATRLTLARVAGFEGLIQVVGAVLLAVGLATAGQELLTQYLPERMVQSTVNPIDLDRRAYLFMVITALLTWILAVVPVVFWASRQGLRPILDAHGRNATSSRSGTRLRRAISIGQLALAACLVVLGALFTRSYQELLAVEKGFDATNLFHVSLSMPNQFYPTRSDKDQLAANLVERLLRAPGVVGATRGSTPPSIGNTPTAGVTMEIDGQPMEGQPVRFASVPIAPDYLQVIGLRLAAGSYFDSSEPEASAIITRAVAERYWPDGHALGRTFRPLSGGWGEQPPFRVVGILQDYRTEPATIPGAQPLVYAFVPAAPAPPPAPIQPAHSAVLDNGGSFGFLTFAVRLDSPQREQAVAAAVQDVDPRLVVEMTPVDELYAADHQATLFVARAVGVFAVIVFLVAVAGVYGVMAVLVVNRTREIAVRTALGADRNRILALVMGSSARLVMIGTAVGLTTAFFVARAVKSLLSGVRPADPVTYVSVAALMIVTAMIATWQPARRACQIDPAVTLKIE